MTFTDVDNFCQAAMTAAAAEFAGKLPPKTRLSLLFETRHGGTAISGYVAFLFSCGADAVIESHSMSGGVLRHATPSEAIAAAIANHPGF